MSLVKVAGFLCRLGTEVRETQTVARAAVVLASGSIAPPTLLASTDEVNE
jgi:hypothetical protein